VGKDVKVLLEPESEYVYDDGYRSTDVSKNELNVQTLPSVPVHPALHVQAFEVLLPAGELEFAGHGKQAPSLAPDKEE